MSRDINCGYCNAACDEKGNCSAGCRTVAEKKPPFTVSFHIGTPECAVCGKGDGCEHLDPPVNRNGDSFDPAVVEKALQGFVGKPVSLRTRGAIADELAQHLGEVPAEMSVAEVDVQKDRIVMNIQMKGRVAEPDDHEERVQWLVSRLGDVTIDDIYAEFREEVGDYQSAQVGMIALRDNEEEIRRLIDKARTNRQKQE